MSVEEVATMKVVDNRRRIKFTDGVDNRTDGVDNRRDGVDKCSLWVLSGTSHTHCWAQQCL